MTRRRVGTNKGFTARDEQQEAALRVQMLDGRHVMEIIAECEDEFGTEAKQMGKVDLSRCPLAAYAERLGTAYRIPPLVTGLGEDLARAIGDASASTTITRYADAGGRPMPTVMAEVSADALRYRLGANWVGVVVGWSARSERPFLQVVTPDDLDVTYASDDPLSPTAIRWRRTLEDGTTAYDVMDLTEPQNPIYLIELGGFDATKKIAGEDLSGANYFWRYDPSADFPEGRPFHRIILSGTPLQPFRNLPLVEGSKRIAAGYTYWWAGMRDAGHPRMFSIGLEYDEPGTSDAESGDVGHAAGPTIIHSLHHVNPDKPGTLQQFGPGFDPEIIGRALRNYEIGLLSATGLPGAWEQTGGEPAATDAAALLEMIQGTFAACRDQDVLVLRRLAAVTNRGSEAVAALGRPRPYPPIPEGGYGVLYREEIAAALALADKAKAEKAAKEAAKTKQMPEEVADAGTDDDGPDDEDPGTGEQAEKDPQAPRRPPGT